MRLVILLASSCFNPFFTGTFFFITFLKWTKYKLTNEKIIIPIEYESASDVNEGIGKVDFEDLPTQSPLL